MDTIKVKKAELLDKVRQNREDHAKDYAEAMVAYKEEAIKALERLLAAAKTGDIRHTIDVVKPREFLKDYDRAIKMLEMGQEEILEITLIDFDQLVMNNWSWQETFKNSTGLYKARP